MQKASKRAGVRQTVGNVLLYICPFEKLSVKFVEHFLSPCHWGILIF